MQGRSSHVCACGARTKRSQTLFLLMRFSIAHATNTQRIDWQNEPAGLLFTSSILAKMASKSGHFVEKRPTVGINIELECLHNRLPRPPPSSRVTECGALVQCCIKIMCRACREKMASHHNELSGRTRTWGRSKTRLENRSSLLFSTNFSSRILAHLEKCLLAARCWGNVCAVGRVRTKRRKLFGIPSLVFCRLRDGDLGEIEKNSRCSSDVWLDRQCA